MAELRNDNTNEQPVSPIGSQENNVCEYEIHIIDYFLVLWNYKWLVLLGSILPALIVGLFFFSLPGSNTVTYVYDVEGWDLNEKNYNIFISKFYSEENLNKIVDKVRENGFNESAGPKASAGSSVVVLKNSLKFEPVPSYVDFSKAKITDTEQLKQIRELTAQLLNVNIVGVDKEKLLNISSVIRDNIENIMPVYMIQKQLSDDMRTYRTGMADIESNRFSLELALKTKKSVLEKFKKMKGSYPDKIEEGIVLQFDVGSNSEYLPLKYQVQAVRSQLVELEEQIVVNEAKYKYYENLLALTGKLSAELKNRASTYYTIRQFHSYLSELAAGHENKELENYLVSYLKRIENRILSSLPISENPKISPISKDTIKKSFFVFVGALMMSVFGAFLLESFKRSRPKKRQ